MKASYNNFPLSDLGEVTITQKREFEGGDAPQCAKVILAVPCRSVRTAAPPKIGRAIWFAFGQKRPDFSP